MTRTLADAAGAFLVGVSGGALFYAIHAPLPWMLGSLFAAALWRARSERFIMPRTARRLARPVIGVLAGAAFTPQVVGSMAGWWEDMLFVAAFGIVTMFVGYVLLSRVLHYDRPTAYFSATPGGIGELILVGSGYGANMTTLAVMHAVRILCVVFTIPLIIQFLTGAPIGRISVFDGSGPDLLALDWAVLALAGVTGYIVGTRIWLPGGVLVGALICSAIVHGLELTAASPPTWLVAAVQVVIGSITGSQIGGISWRRAGHVLFVALVWAAILICLAVLAALLWSHASDRSFASMLLALSPGGMTDMTVITYSLGLDVAFVVCCQVVRTTLTLAVAPAIFSWLDGNNKRPKE